MASNLMRYQGQPVIAMRGHGNRYVVYVGCEFRAVVRRTGWHWYESADGSAGKTLKAAIQAYLERKGA